MAQNNDVVKEQVVTYTIDDAQNDINSLIEAFNALNEKVHYLEKDFYRHAHLGNNVVIKTREQISQDAVKRYIKE